MRRLTWALLLVVFLAGALAAEENPDVWQFYPFPVLFYSPETGIGGGAAVTVLREPVGASRPDILNAIGFYTQKNQISLVASADWQMAAGRQILNTGILVNRFPAVFYGVGPDTRDGAKEDYTPRSLELELGYRWRIGPSFSLGPLYRLLLVDMEDIEDNGALALREPVGADGTSVSGGGVEAVWDTRDDGLYPTTGFYVRGRVLAFPDWMGTTDVFFTTRLDARGYWRVLPDQLPGLIFAAQTLLDLNYGEIPFEEMPSLGGAAVLRGYTSGRYIDKMLLACQVEARFPLFWRFGVVTFGGLAQVAPEMREMVEFRYVRIAGGAGLRFRLTEEQPLNLRLDAAYSQQGFQFYISATEAF